MEYKVNDVVINVSDVMEYLRKGYILNVCKIIQEKSGCTLAAAQDLYHEMIQVCNLRVAHFKEVVHQDGVAFFFRQAVQGFGK